MNRRITLTVASLAIALLAVLMIAIPGTQAQPATQPAGTQPAGAHSHHDRRHGHSHHDRAAGFDDVERAVAVLYPTQGNQVRGVVLFEQTDDGKVTVTANVTGLKPGSKHGFHIHQYGDATSADGTSAGGHYNPEGHDHGLPGEQEELHAGDLGNLEANDQGQARLEKTVDNITLAGGKNPILGRGLVVHAEPDDGGQPTGNAGGRIAVGVIGVAQPAQ